MICSDLVCVCAELGDFALTRHKCLFIFYHPTKHGEAWKPGEESGNLGARSLPSKKVFISGAQSEPLRSLSHSSDGERSFDSLGVTLVLVLIGLVFLSFLSFLNLETCSLSSASSSGETSRKMY